MTPVFINRSRRRMPRLFVGQWLKAVGRELAKRRIKGHQGMELSVVFLPRAEARRLNRRYRRRDYATDVLSFAGDGRELLGELVLCPEVLERQAKEHQLSFKAELAYMLLHGVLHLLGFEHEKGGAEARRMFELQDQIFERLKRLHSPR